MNRLPKTVTRQRRDCDLNLGARDSEWQWYQLGHMQVCTSLQTDNHASTPPLSPLQAGCPSCRPTNSVKALKAVVCLQCFDYKDNTTIKEHNTKKIHSKLNTPQTEIPRIHNISKLYTCMSISLQTLSASFKRLKARQRKQK